MTKTKSPYRSTYHRDGDVTLWMVYEQCWRRMHCTDISDETLATLTAQERQRIERMVERAQKAAR